MTKCQHCDAEVLSTSQPNRMGTTPEMQKMYDEFGGEAIPVKLTGEIACILEDCGPPDRQSPEALAELIRHYQRTWDRIREALAATPAVGGEREALDEAMRDMKRLARELQQGLPKRNAAERLEAMSASAEKALARQTAAGGEADWWRWRFQTEGRWSKWISLNDDEISAFRELQGHHLESGHCELQPLYAAQPASPLRGRDSE